MPKHRGHNDGSIYQRQSDGRWVASISLAYGKRKSLYGKTRADVRDKLKQAQREQERGLDLSAKTETVAQFLTRWLEDVARPSVRPSTYDSYAGHVRNHLIPALGHLKLAQLAPQDVQALLKVKTAAGLSPRTVAYIRAVLRRALGQALKWGLVTRNVATLVDPPRLNQKPVRPLTPSQVRTFLDATKDDRLGPLFHVAIATGLRQGELFGLRWDDLDLDAQTLTVRHAMQRVKEGDDKAVPRFVDPKTDKSRRTVNVPASAVAALRSQRVRQMEARLLAGERWQGEQWRLVFATTVGTPLNPSNVTHRLQRLLSEGGLPRQRFHDLRHCCASLMLAQNVPARVVMETLGHSQISLTLNTYSHVMPAMQRDAADLLDALLTANA